jgi:hypothetical protein
MQASEHIMTRWIAFDEESTAAAAAHTKVAVAFQQGDALRSAVASNRNGIVILPTDRDDQFTLLRLRRSIPKLEEEPVTYEPTGVLGLTDRVRIEEQSQPPRKWWQRILD